MHDIDRMTTAQKADLVLDLLASTPDGVIRDADTVLKDIMDEADFEVTGIAAEIIGIWKKSGDKPSVEELFKSFTCYGFAGWLNKCIRETTRSAGSVQPDRIRMAEGILAESGVRKEDCEDVLRSLGNVLMGEDLYPRKPRNE